MVEKNQYYDNYLETTDEMLETEPFLQEFVDRLSENKNSFYMYNKQVEKEVDLSWVEAIEDTVISLDNVIRNPRKFIEVKEELLPIELSRNITPDSIKYLAQHTNLINSISDDGTINPSKIMNYIKEESMQTYENKFVNTLIDRLYSFIEIRFRKINDTANDENIGVFQFDSHLPGENDDYVTMKVVIEAHQTVGERSEDSQDELLERVRKLRSILMEYKASPFVKEMQGAYIRPPIMRTNAILKNPDLKQCLICWQFIESYDKIGYSVRTVEGTHKPSDEYIREIYKLSAMNYGVFQHFMSGEMDRELILKERRSRKKITPKFIKRMISNVMTNYDVNLMEFNSLMSRVFDWENSTEGNVDAKEIQDAIERVIQIEKSYHDREKAENTRRREEKTRRLQEKKEQEERKRQELEAEIERQKQAAVEEEERQKREKEEEEERRRQAILAEENRIKREKEQMILQEKENRRMAALAAGSFAAVRVRPIRSKNNQTSRRKRR